MIFSRLKEVEIPSRTLCPCCNAWLTVKTSGNLSFKSSSSTPVKHSSNFSQLLLLSSKLLVKLLPPPRAPFKELSQCRA